MNLARTSIYSLIAAAVRIASAVALNKVLAVYLGPAGLAVVGQLQNLAGVASVAASGALGTGIVKYSAQAETDNDLDRKVFATSLRIVVGLSLVVAVACALASSLLATLLFGDPERRVLLLVFASSILLSSLGGWALAFINGRRDVRKYVWVSVLSNIASLTTTAVLTVEFGIDGALAGTIASPVFTAAIALVVLLRSKWFDAAYLREPWDGAIAAGLGHFAMMSLVSGILGPTVQVLIRDQLTTAFGWNEAGYWQALVRISDYYLLAITTTLGIYYLPMLARIKTTSEMFATMRSVASFVMPLAIVGAIAIFALRDFIIAVLFSPDFLPMRDLFTLQLAGDVVKMGSWLLGYVLLSRGMTAPYIAAEIAFAVSYVAGTALLLPILGLRGVTAAYVGSYLLYLAFLTVALKRYLPRS